MFSYRFYELDADQQPIHFSCYDAKVHPGVAHTGNEFWDVYRTNYPFWSIVYPEQLGEILQVFLDSYREGGRFPQWPRPAAARWNDRLAYRCGHCRC